MDERKIQADRELLRGCAGPLIAWHESSRRALPWRDAPTPYQVWVSEIMLQQTRIEAVIPYYGRFMKELPTVEALARDFRRTGYSDVAAGWLNGIPAIRFERPEDDYRGVAFFHPVYPDYVLYVYVSPRDSAEGVILLASVTPLSDFTGQVKK